MRDQQSGTVVTGHPETARRGARETDGLETMRWRGTIREDRCLLRLSLVVAGLLLHLTTGEYRNSDSSLVT